MSNFPFEFDTFRTTENRPSVVYDPLKKTTLFSEDINNLTAAVAAIEQALGLNYEEFFPDIYQAITGLVEGKISSSDVYPTSGRSFTVVATGGTITVGNTFTTTGFVVYDREQIQLYRQIQITAAGVTNLQIRINRTAVANSGLNARRLRVSFMQNTTTAAVVSKWFPVAQTSGNTYCHIDVPMAWLTGNSFPATGIINIDVDGFLQIA